MYHKPKLLITQSQMNNIEINGLKMYKYTLY